MAQVALGKVEGQFAFPTQTLHVDSLSAAQPARARRAKTREQLVEAVLAAAPGGAKGIAETPLFAGGFFPEAAADAEAEAGDGAAG